MGTNRPDIYINPIGNTQGGGDLPSSVGSSYYTTTAPKDGITDAQPQLQADIDYCINNGITALFIPKGIYLISKPLYIGKDDGSGNHQAVTLQIFGESSMWDTNTGSNIKPSFTDTFALGIQRGKGCVVRNITFQGKFVPLSGADNYTFFNYSFDSFTDGVCRDSRFSPYSAIVIDPFSNGQMPSDGGYPGMTSRYSGSGGLGGSTGTIIKDVEIFGFVVGVCSSPNGFTRNAEITTIENIRFLNLKLCVSGGQDQEKANRIINFGAWGGIHTVFATGHYGGSSVGHWDIDTGNIAGQVVRLIDNTESGYYPTHVKNIFAESIGSFGNLGNLGGRIATKVQNCMFNFELPVFQGMMNSLITSVGNVVFDSCTFRYYGTDTPISIDGDATFKNCSFGGFPYYTNIYAYARFVDCVANAIPLGVTGMKTSAGAMYAYGDWTLDNYFTDFNKQMGNQYGFFNTISSKSQEIYIALPDDNVNVVVTGRTATFTTLNAAQYFSNAFVKIGEYRGLVTSISGNNVVVDYLPINVPSGAYKLYVFHPVLFNGIFIGDITNGSSKITNCVAHSWWDAGSVNFFGGAIVKNPYGGSRHLYITNAITEANGSVSLTFYGSITTTQSNVVFGNYSYQEVYTDTPSTPYGQSGYIVRRGDKVITQKGSENSIEYSVVRGGLLSGNTRQALLAKPTGTWTGTQAQYDAIVNPSDDIIYYITNTAP